jgi:hypothetical protein
LIPSFFAATAQCKWPVNGYRVLVIQYYTYNKN